MLPSLLNKFFVGLLKIEAWMMGAINLPFGTSIMVLAQRAAQEDRMVVRAAAAGEEAGI
jgi:hypothetical protein